MPRSSSTSYWNSAIHYVIRCIHDCIFNIGYANSKVVRIYNFHNTVAYLILRTKSNIFTYTIHIYLQENIWTLSKEKNDNFKIESDVQY